MKHSPIPLVFDYVLIDTDLPWPRACRFDLEPPHQGRTQRKRHPRFVPPSLEMTWFAQQQLKKKTKTSYQRRHETQKITRFRSAQLRAPAERAWNGQRKWWRRWWAFACLEPRGVQVSSLFAAKHWGSAVAFLIRFSVPYLCLQKELRIGDYYIRLLLDPPPGLLPNMSSILWYYIFYQMSLLSRKISFASEKATLFSRLESTQASRPCAVLWWALSQVSPLW